MTFAGSLLYIVSGTTVGVYNPLTGKALNDSLITGLNNPEGLAAANGDLFVVDHGSGSVGEYDLTQKTYNPKLHHRTRQPGVSGHQRAGAGDMGADAGGRGGSGGGGVSPAAVGELKGRRTPPSLLPVPGTRCRSGGGVFVTDCLRHRLANVRASLMFSH